VFSLNVTRIDGMIGMEKRKGTPKYLKRAKGWN